MRDYLYIITEKVKICNDLFLKCLKSINNVYYAARSESDMVLKLNYKKIPAPKPDYVLKYLMIHNDQLSV